LPTQHGQEFPFHSASALLSRDASERCHCRHNTQIPKAGQKASLPLDIPKRFWYPPASEQPYFQEDGPMNTRSSSALPQFGGEQRTKHNMVLWGSIAGVCITALAATYMLFVEAPPPSRIVIATGAENGAYYRFARQYADELKKDGLTLEIRTTAGSVENLKLLQDDRAGVSVAIVQSGVAAPAERERLQALGSLYREPLWVFYRSEALKTETVDRISQLAGKRVGVGLVGSGTYAIAEQLLAANGVAEGQAGTVLTRETVSASADALQRGELDAAFFVAAFDADYIRSLLTDPKIRVLSFAQHEAYHRKFRFLSQVTVPAGLVQLGQNLPSEDVALVAPTAMLVVRKDLHPALVPLFLAAATRVHGKGDELSVPGEFPCASYTDFAINDDARHFYASGPPVLQRLLPFWLASLADRLKVMLIPLVMLLMPLFRAAPPLVRWRTRRKIYVWYAALREIDQQRLTAMTPTEIEAVQTRLREIERQVAHVEVPLSYMDDLYHLRLHLAMVQDNLHTQRLARGTHADGHEPPALRLVG
jgi:TRAP transporter TAXI family solute receptor